MMQQQKRQKISRATISIATTIGIRYGRSYIIISSVVAGFVSWIAMGYLVLSSVNAYSNSTMNVCSVFGVKSITV